MLWSRFKPEYEATLRKLLQFIATICLGPISLGSSVAWTSPVLPQLQNASSDAPFNLTVSEGSWVGSMMAIGALIAAIPAGYLADRFGRKKCAIGFAMPVVVFATTVIFTRDVYSLCVARLFSGIATGGVSVVAPMYISEISDLSLRGTLGSFFELLIYVGVVFTNICGAYVHYLTLTAILGGLALVLIVCFTFFPESPTYLIKVEKRKRAEEALKFYRSPGHDVARELDNISENIRARSREQRTNVRKLLVSKPVMRGLLASVGLTVFQQLSAIDGITFYTVQIFQAADADTQIDAYTSAIIISAFFLVSAVTVMFTIERAGRKVFIYISSAGCGICLAVLGIYFHLKEYNISFAGMMVMPLTSLVLYTFAFAIGLGPIPWLLNGELFAPEIKGVANGITITANWSFLFLVSKTLPVMMEHWSPAYTFYIYSAFMVVCVVFNKFFIPETRGMTLEQIQLKLRS